MDNNTVEANIKKEKFFEGEVLSNKMNKSIVIKIEYTYKHPVFKKYIKKSKKLMAHDEDNKCNIGDVVQVKMHRPVSKRKAFVLSKIVQKVQSV